MVVIRRVLTLLKTLERIGGSSEFGLEYVHSELTDNLPRAQTIRVLVRFVGDDSEIIIGSQYYMYYVFSDAF
jgi:hypothetical protein